MGFMDKIKKITGVDGYDDNNYEDDGYYDDVIGGGYESDADAQNSQPVDNSQTQYVGGGYSAPSNDQYGGRGYQQPTQPAAPAMMGGINIGGSALQMKVIRPESFGSVNQIADHLLSQRTVVLNLEATNKETARRLIDFLSGVAYSIDGSLKRIANNAYIITPSNVDVSGDQLREQRRPQQQPTSDDDAGYTY